MINYADPNQDPTTPYGQLPQFQPNQPPKVTAPVAGAAPMTYPSTGGPLFTPGPQMGATEAYNAAHPATVGNGIGYGSPNDTTAYANPQDLLIKQLNAGYGGPDYSAIEGLISGEGGINSRFNLGYGSGGDVQTGRGINGSPVIGFKGGYVALGPDGQWGWNPTNEGGGAAASAVDLSTLIPGAAPNPLADPNASALFDLLMSRAKQSEVVDPNDPIIKAQTDAYKASQDEAERKYLQQVAEKAGPNASISAETRSAAESAGQNTSGFQATLMANELSARRAEIQSALSGAAGLLSSEQQLALQTELGLIDEKLKEAGLQEQAYQFDTGNYYLGSPLSFTGA